MRALTGLTALLVLGLAAPGTASEPDNPSSSAGDTGVGTSAAAGKHAPSMARAVAGTTIGQTPMDVSSAFGCSALTGVQTASGATGPSYVVPSPGVITSFSHLANPQAGTSMRAVLYRNTTGTHFSVVPAGPMRSLTPDTLNTFSARVPVQAGDLLGLQVSDNVSCAVPGVSGDAHYLRFGFDPSTQTDFDTAAGASFASGNRWNVSAVLEPDADRDGYGDLTQDLCPSSATTHGSCPLPETSLTKKPKKQVHKRATVFKFASSLPGSRFECSVDHATFKPCTSPFRKKFRPGKHTFEVRAVDAAGNVDPTPAKVRWRFVPVG